MRNTSSRGTGAVLALCAALSTGCYSFTANVPGVLDLRSDGSQASVSSDKLPPGEHTRDGVGGFMFGNGLQPGAAPADVTIEDRHWWAIGLFTIMNPSIKEEVQAALGKGAMRKVYIGEEQTFMDIGLTIGMSIVAGIIPGVNGILIPLVRAITPPMTSKLSGTRIAVSGAPAGGEAMPPPTDPMPPPAEGTAPPTDAAPAPAPTTGGAQ
jgi:hypothetical protein